MSATADDARRLAVTGYVEVMTKTVVLGWAWSPGRAEPLAVELRLGAEVIAEATADGHREDLASNGIGDGRHAFRITVPEAMRARLADLRVFARTPDGAAVPIGSPPADGGVEDRLAQLGRGIELLIGSQRVLHRNVQSALLSAPQAGGSASIDVAATQAAVLDGIATLELFVVRLEQGMAGLAAQAAQPTSPRWALAGIAAVAGTSLVLSLWALIHVMPG